MNTNRLRRKKLNAVDWIIIFLLIVGIAGIVLRFTVLKSAPDPSTLPDTASKKYYVSFTVKDVRYSLSDYMTAGTEFRFDGSGRQFGTIYGELDIKNALRRYCDSNGNAVAVYNTSDDESAARFDISGTFEVSGKLNDGGVLIIDGNPDESICLNKTISVRSDLMVMDISVTQISESE